MKYKNFKFSIKISLFILLAVFFPLIIIGIFNASNLSNIYDISMSTWVVFLGSIYGGEITLIGVILTINHKDKENQLSFYGLYKEILFYTQKKIQRVSGNINTLILYDLNKYDTSGMPEGFITKELKSALETIDKYYDFKKVNSHKIKKIGQSEAIHDLIVDIYDIFTLAYSSQLHMEFSTSMFYDGFCIAVKRVSDLSEINHDNMYELVEYINKKNDKLSILIETLQNKK